MACSSDGFRDVHVGRLFYDSLPSGHTAHGVSGGNDELITARVLGGQRWHRDAREHLARTVDAASYPVGIWPLPTR